MKDTMVQFKVSEIQYAITLTNVKIITLAGNWISFIFNDDTYRNFECKTQLEAENLFDGIANAKASGNEVYKIIG